MEGVFPGGKNFLEAALGWERLAAAGHDAEREVRPQVRHPHHVAGADSRPAGHRLVIDQHFAAGAVDVPTVFAEPQHGRSAFAGAIALGIEEDFATGIGTHPKLVPIEHELLALPGAGKDEYFYSHGNNACLRVTCCPVYPDRRRKPRSRRAHIDRRPVRPIFM